MSSSQWYNNVVNYCEYQTKLFSTENHLSIEWFDIRQKNLLIKIVLRNVYYIDEDGSLCNTCHFFRHDAQSDAAKKKKIQFTLSYLSMKLMCKFRRFCLSYGNTCFGDLQVKWNYETYKKNDRLRKHTWIFLL